MLETRLSEVIISVFHTYLGFITWSDVKYASKLIFCGFFKKSLAVGLVRYFEAPEHSYV